jgi:hypothetical protein
MSASLLFVTVVAFAEPSSRGPEPVAPVLDAAYSSRVNRRARGLGIGLNQGLWGQSFGQSLHLDIPFGRRVGQFFGMRVQGTFVHAPARTPGWDPTVFGGLELFGRSPVMGGVVRIYGGGGVFAGGRPLPTDRGRHWGVAGGGHMGIEAFAQPFMSFSVEIGGQGPVHALGYDAGASVMGGINFYFGR